MVFGDAMNSVSLLEVTDANGTPLQDLGYSVSFQSRVTFASAVPEPASFTIFAIGAASFGLLAIRRRRA